MLITPHIAVGAGIGNLSDSMGWVIVLSVLSHYILDSLPHYDLGVKYNYRKNILFDGWDYLLLGTDIIIGICLMLWAWQYTGKITVLAGGLATFMVDFIDRAFYLEIDWKNKKVRFNFEKELPIIKYTDKLHRGIHFRLKNKYWYWGVVVSLIALAVGLYMIML